VCASLVAAPVCRLQVTDLHRHFIDDITIPSSQGKGVLRRVDDVFDCWFESGSMPYGQVGQDIGFEFISYFGGGGAQVHG
jgi:isoleucyl-tRNA synthetase